MGSHLEASPRITLKPPRCPGVPNNTMSSRAQVLFLCLPLEGQLIPQQGPGAPLRLDDASIPCDCS